MRRNVAKKKTTRKKNTSKKNTNTKNTKTSTRSTRKTKAEIEKDEEVTDWIAIVVLVAIAFVAVEGFGLIGELLNDGLKVLFGDVYLLMIGVVIAQLVIMIVNRRSGNIVTKNPLAIVFIMMAILMIASYRATDHGMKGLDIVSTYAKAVPSFFTTEATIEAGGGILGALMLSLTTMAFDYAGSVVVIVVLIIVSLLLLINLDVYKQAARSVWEFFRTPDEDDDEEEYEEEDYYEEEPLKEKQVYHPAPSITKIPEIDVPEIQETTSTNTVHMINLYDTPVEAEPVEELPVDEPVKRAAIDIRVDEEEVESDELVLPQDEKIIEEAKEEPVSKTIFMNVDELIDNIHNPVKAENEDIIANSIDRVEQSTVAAPLPTAPQPVVTPIPEEVTPIIQQTEKPYISPYEQPNAPEQMENTVPNYKNTTVVVPETPIGTRRNKPYVLPKYSLLDPVPPQTKDDVNVKAAQEKGQLLIDVLRNFDIEAELLDIHIGPAVTKFEIRPSATTKVSRILNLTDDIKMQMAVRDIRIEAPIPGRNAVGVEVPNIKATPVKMREIIGNISEKDKEDPLTFLLGKDLLGNVVSCRMDKMPHLLIAGATGSGKSVCMNTIITSFLMRTKPDEVKLLLVDPKKVEFTPYQKIPHLIGPVINDPMQASNALKVIVKIMDERYNTFAKMGVRNIQGYNAKIEAGYVPEDGSPIPSKMYYIVVIVDEMADLMAVAGKEVETSIQRITQLARAAGIHLIIATQRPSVDVITGIIKANVPSRIAFAVSSAIDSKTILDHSGAERLLGNGDMLYMPMGTSNATRVQGVFVTDDEVQRITDYVSAQAVPMYDDAFIRLDAIDSDDEHAVTGADADPLFEEVKEYVIDVQKASTSLLQRRFGIGYNRAARMIDILEQNGVIGPQQGSKPRDVYMKKEE